MKRDAIDERMNALPAACERLGIKLTHQRREIFRAVISTEDHPDAESVYRRVRKRIPTVSLDTVYRNLRLLADHGLISVVGMSQDRVRFDGNITPHHHFTCIQCGMVRDFVSPSFSALEIPDGARAFGAPLSLHLEVKGVCTACRRKERHG